MEIIEFIFTWILPLFLIYFLYQSKKELVRINRIFQQLADDNHGTVSRRTWFGYPTLAVQDQGFTFELGFSLAPGGNVWVTRLNMAHHHAIDFELRLQPHNQLEKMAAAIGFQDAAIGTAQFNASFLVKTGDESKARHFINRDMQQALLRLKNLNPELAITESAIILTTSFIVDIDDFRLLVDFGMLLCQRLRDI